MKKFLLLLLIPALFWNCSTELDVLDDWEETMVVYCLLDQSSSRQYIRIEKAFLGDENALTMAQVYDSVYYLNQLEVTVQAIDNNNVVKHTYTNVNSNTIFTDTVEKDPGIFAGPNHVLYAFNTPFNDTAAGGLWSPYQYRLTIKNTVTGKTVTASTDLVETSGSGSGIFTLVAPNPSSATVNFVPTTTVGDFEVKWNAAPSAVIYQPTLRFFYTENYVSGSAQLATPEMQLQMTQPSLSSQTSQQSVKFDKLNFYRFVGNSISYNPSVVERIAGVVEITVYAGNQILKDYININGASNSISQEHPLYTNIEGGYGVFASRTHLTKVVSSQPTNQLHTFNLSNTGSSTTTNSVDLLAIGPYTCHLLFRNSVGQAPGCQ